MEQIIKLQLLNVIKMLNEIRRLNFKKINILKISSKIK